MTKRTVHCLRQGENCSIFGTEMNMTYINLKFILLPANSKKNCSSQASRLF